MSTSFDLIFIRVILLSNGVVDILVAFALIAFPAFGWPLPGYSELSYQAAYAAGGWGTAALCFGLGRVWAAYQPQYAWYMAVLGLIEGFVLTVYSLGRILWSPTTFLQGALALAVSATFGLAYGLGLIMHGGTKKPGLPKNAGRL